MEIEVRKNVKDLLTLTRFLIFHSSSFPSWHIAPLTPMFYAIKVLELNVKFGNNYLMRKHPSLILTICWLMQYDVFPLSLILNAYNLIILWWIALASLIVILY